jgi:hypothetical protein
MDHPEAYHFRVALIVIDVIHKFFIPAAKMETSIDMPNSVGQVARRLGQNARLGNEGMLKCLNA